MGVHLGNLVRMRHMITYKLSPFEQRLFPKNMSKEVVNLWRRINSYIFRVAPPLASGYLIYSWGTQEFERLKRKNPADYENDE
ncbi:cytochrome b-c1 complex subunit 8 [Varanus komodoensis]|uniref:Cytochrome b-c1 complex subunit 8 n=1 Tax=Varanus komodoensis TaxID=61221 RepID=A0A8D2KVJ5_VARKO|nr:cytochrome b-c1 complex subunit 8 [Varanus komodoensis]